jgi:hypothetical protein
MPPADDYINLKRALKDYLKEEGIILKDLLSAMDETKGGIMEAIRHRAHLTEAQSRALERAISSKDLNLLLFVIQVFYLLNPAGIYKDLFIEPAREDIVYGDKITFEGCKMILKALGIPTQHLDI